MIGGQAPMTLAVMWTVTAITLIFVVIRLYTRACIVRQIGADDYVYVVAGSMLLFYTIFLTVSATYGFGQDITTLSVDDAAKAVLWEMISQTFAILGMAVAKFSLGLFLLRIVVKKWHKVAIWMASASLLFVSILTAIIFWLQCIPVGAIYDPLRVKGVCNLPVSPYAILLGAWCAMVDFFFAGFPWLFIFQLNMKYKEKITIAGSMSLGVLAGICGIVRTIELGGLSSRNYTLDTVNLIVWSAAELAVTMVCIGIPLLRPLYRRMKNGTDASTEGYYKQNESDGQTNSSYGMKNLGSKNDIENNRGFPDAPSQLGIRGPSTVTYIGPGGNTSDEEILGPEFRQAGHKGNMSAGAPAVRMGQERQQGIQVTDELRIDYNKKDHQSSN